MCRNVDLARRAMTLARLQPQPLATTSSFSLLLDITTGGEPSFARYSGTASGSPNQAVLVEVLSFDSRRADPLSSQHSIKVPFAHAEQLCGCNDSGASGAHLLQHLGTVTLSLRHGKDSRLHGAYAPTVVAVSPKDASP